MNDKEIELEIQAKGLTAPRVTPGDIEANIASEIYFTGAAAFDAMRMQWLTDDHKGEAMERCRDVLESMKTSSYSGSCLAIDRAAGIVEMPQSLGLLTFCVLVLRNGFTVVGKSACVSAENFDAELGRKIAREDAINQLWPLMGYALADRIHRGE